jgi:hypothetical protein
VIVPGAVDVVIYCTEEGGVGGEGGHFVVGGGEGGKGKVRRRVD